MYASRPESNPRIKDIGETFQSFLNQLESQQFEYDLGSEQILREFGSSEGAKLVNQTAHLLEN